MASPDTDTLPSRTKSILVLGAGELGTAIIDALLAHPSYTPSRTQITLLVRPSSLSSPSPSKRALHDSLRVQGVTIIGGDVEAQSIGSLAALFRPYTTVLHAGGMSIAPGTITKVTRAVLVAKVEYYVPWQHGVDYDAITRRGGQGMFAEQIDVRDLLRQQAGTQSEAETQWVVLSCGIFMSFLFEEFWGVVKRLPAPEGKQEQQRVQVTALNSWDDMLTTTSAEDIGLCTASLLFSPSSPVNRPVYIAGDTLSYGDLADVVGCATGKEVVREVWPLEYLRHESEKDPEDKLKRYRVVFAEGKGLSWPKEETWSAKAGIKMMGVEDWVRKNYQ